MCTYGLEVAIPVQGFDVGLPHVLLGPSGKHCLQTTALGMEAFFQSAKGDSDLIFKPGFLGLTLGAEWLSFQPVFSHGLD